MLKMDVEEEKRKKEEDGGVMATIEVGIFDD